MFGRPSKQARLEIMKAIMNANIKEGTRVCQYVLKIIVHINDDEINGTVTDHATKVRVILEILSHNFL